ncbi:MAG: hypothetical protein JSW50_13735 [Candidatus Latescibacterota bacterium]|nr:MAG: hypothetical protein JSW50_13735 [Candidatus Latescibacterota bacterium]
MASVATTLKYLGTDVDPAWLMGTSGFAFRILTNEVMCPSAASVFNWIPTLAETFEQSGYQCVYISRLWHEQDKEAARREEAHQAIVAAVDRGVPAVVWDVAEAEWGLITGYDDRRQLYETLTWEGEPLMLAYEKLGRNGIDVLSVAIPGDGNERTREAIVFNSLRAAVLHAEQGEWTDRPKYQDGLPAYDLWATLLERWALIVRAGRGQKISPHISSHAMYYAAQWYSARCYARDYLKGVAGRNENLLRATLSYRNVASLLKPVWDVFKTQSKPDQKSLLGLARRIRDARAEEEEGIDYIKGYLAEQGGTS